VVEKAKQMRLQGFYIHPRLHGAAEEKQMERARRFELMKRTREKRGMARVDQGCCRSSHSSHSQVIETSSALGT
jgi:hypothetical protein